jgi:hypothetical protein
MPLLLPSEKLPPYTEAMQLQGEVLREIDAVNFHDGTIMINTEVPAITYDKTALHLGQNECMVVALGSVGMSNQDIADLLDKKPDTISKQRRIAYEKLRVSPGSGVDGMPMATRKCVDQGIFAFRRPIPLPSRLHNMKTLDDRFITITDGVSTGASVADVQSWTKRLSDYDFDAACAELELQSPAAAVLFAAGVKSGW